MDFISILLFFVYTWGLGYSITYFLINSDDFFERNIMRIGFGLGLMVLLGVFLNLLRIPIDWKIFLIFSLAIPVFLFIKKHKDLMSKFSFRLKITKSNISLIIVFILFFFTLFMYLKGAFIIPYLEDDDPWGHAESVMYISLEKTAFEPDINTENFHYIDPYPPGYDLVMAVLYQTSKSLMWTLKFFNSLIISLSILFFYFFTKKFIGNRNKALIATFALVAIPSYLSHFIWALSLIVTLFIPAFYSLEKIKEDRKWLIAASVMIASIFLVQPTHAIKFSALFFIYYLIKVILDKKLHLEHLSSFILGAILSLSWWVPSILRKGSIISASKTIGFSQAASIDSSGFTGIFSLLDKVLHIKGTATRLYTFDDFFIAEAQNMINNPIGVGIFLSILIAGAIIWILINIKDIRQPENQWKLIALIWVVFTFLGIHGCTRLPICLFSFRFWMLFALTSSILVPEGFEFFIKLFGKIKIHRYIIIFILIIGIITTSLSQKYSVNTSQWGPGGAWTSFDEVSGYVWLKTLPPKTKVFPYSGWDGGVIGFDKFSCKWCPEVIEFRNNLPNRSIQDLYQFLKSNGYEYIIFDGMSVRNLQQKYSQNDSAGIVNQKINEAVNSNRFIIAHQTPGVAIFKVI